MNKYSTPILILGLIFTETLLTHCTKKDCPASSTSAACPASQYPNNNSGDNGGGGNNPNPANPPNPPPAPPVTLDPAVDPNYKFVDLNDYCSKLATYALGSVAGPGDKILGCWVLRSLIPTPGAPVQSQVCDFTGKSGVPFTTCGIYIYDHYRPTKGRGCGIVTSVKDVSVKTFKVFGDLGFAKIYNNWSGDDGLFSSLPSLEGFTYLSSGDLITKDILSDDNKEDGGGVLFQKESLTFGRFNSTLTPDDSITAQFMQSNGCALPYKLK